MPSASPVSVSRLAAGGLHRARDAEVGHQRVALAPSRMFSGLMSRWTTPCLVGVVERVGHLPGEPDRILDRKLALAPEPLAQALALDVRHGVPEEPAGLAGVEDGQDVRMLRAGR